MIELIFAAIKWVIIASLAIPLIDHEFVMKIKWRRVKEWFALLRFGFDNAYER